ncbi:type II secretion system F family protein [Nocardioides bruguierae]|uniref:Type II secretion system F family protein n=1 Tax=Nocardioides bruguierae TaxID=2945102 RepID=A0A9X2D4K5_9ACTN|nr:type II secretion system F family protein [Nocardioides bruguierae]MCM0619226.1 type II secretion system F family protein [Nocardioides bruguierae]
MSVLTAPGAGSGAGTTRARRLAASALVVGLVAGLLLLVGPLVGPAHGKGTGAGDGGLDIAYVQTAEDGRVSVLLDQGADLTSPLEDVEVSVDDTLVDADVAQVTGQVDRTIVLALDASRSMAGARIAAAREAVEAFLAAVPDDVAVGLVSFAGEVETTVEPTTDRAQVRDAVADLTLRRGTRLYDGVAAAAAATGSTGARSVLVLSDGRDTGGGVDLAAAIAAVEDSGVALDAVALDQDAADVAPVRRMVDAAEGTLVDAQGAAALTDVFAAQADALGRQLLITFERPAGLASLSDVDLSVSATAGGLAVGDRALVDLRAADDGLAGASAAVGRSLVGTTGLLVGGVALAAGVFALLALVLLQHRGPSAAQRTVARYLGETPLTQERTTLRDSALAVTNSLVKQDFEARFSQRLTGAGLAMTVAEWVLLHAGIAVLAGLVGLLLGGLPLLLLLLVLGAAAPYVALRVLHGRRLAAFGAQLPETLTMISGGLSAGLSVAQSIDTVVREGAEPMASELRRALAEHRLGIPVEDALENVADRMGSPDFAWVVMAIRIQREVGGNLAELLDTVAGTLREREYLRRQVRTLSAEGRISAYILVALPILMLGYMLVANREYASFFYTSVLGVLVLAGGGLLLALGSFVMSRMVKVEV